MTLIDKEALLEKLSTFHPDYTFNITSFRNFIKAQPEVDAVPVIRCKECKHWDTTWQSNWGENCHYCPFTDGVHNGDWYCADAERRTDE